MYLYLSLRIYIFLSVSRPLSLSFSLSLSIYIYVWKFLISRIIRRCDGGPRGVFMPYAPKVFSGFLAGPYPRALRPEGP